MQGSAYSFVVRLCSRYYLHCIKLPEILCKSIFNIPKNKNTHQPGHPFGRVFYALHTGFDNSTLIDRCGIFTAKCVC